MLRNNDAECPAIFIGGLPLTANWQTVYQYLRMFGKVEVLHVPRCKQTGRINGYAKAYFSSNQSLEVLMAQPEHLIDGLSVRISLWKRKGDYISNENNLSSRKTYVKFDFDYSAEQLRTCFSRFGPIQQIDKKYHPITKQPRKFSYVVFKFVESARVAARIGKHHFLGNDIFCEISKPICNSAPIVKIAQQKPLNNKNLTRSPSSVEIEEQEIRDFPSSHNTLVKNTESLEYCHKLDRAETNCGFKSLNPSVYRLKIADASSECLHLTQKQELGSGQQRVFMSLLKPTSKLYHNKNEAFRKYANLSSELGTGNFVYRAKLPIQQPRI
jgi:RNA recognition motif-containing protein